MTTIVRTSAANFFDEWSIYDQILTHNYMYHDEIFEHVRHFLAARYDNTPFNILDLGCGSALHLARALENRSVSGYLGYDLSDAALAHAESNLKFFNCAVELHCGDLLDGVRDSAGTVDVIFSSFALHHLSSTQKAEFFAAAYRRLSRHGIFLVIDTMRHDDEDRATYLDRYCAWLGSRCKTLSPEALKHLFAHIRANDFPENDNELEAMAVRAGFARKVEVSRYQWHHGWCFSKFQE
jgi:SAM-dependent methyltransferase